MIELFAQTFWIKIYSVFGLLFISKSNFKVCFIVIANHFPFFWFLILNILRGRALRPEPEGQIIDSNLFKIKKFEFWLSLQKQNNVSMHPSKSVPDLPKVEHTVKTWNINKSYQKILVEVVGCKLNLITESF